MSEKPTNPKDLCGIAKVPISCVPANVLAELGTAMFEGQCKYGRHNYRAVGVRASIYYDALMRHMMAWWEGEDIDAASGMSHVTKAMTTLIVLRDSMLQGNLNDDRPPKSQPFYPALNAAVVAIAEKHADKNPKHFTEIEENNN